MPGGLSRGAVLALVGIVLLLISTPPAGAQVGVPCDPDIRTDNPACGPRVCRRFGGTCGPFGTLNWACQDSAASDRATAPAPAGCDLVCSGSTGACETGVPCNVTTECLDGEDCWDGVCTPLDAVPAPPPPDDGPECEIDANCGAGRLCVDQQCVTGDCRGDWQCRTDEVCLGNQCSPRCAEDETWVPNPIGSPPIPLGRCQETADLLSCCYDSASRFEACREPARRCPVNQACSPIGVCYDICGDGPCPGSLPERPEAIPPPGRWPELIGPAPAPAGRAPILWRDRERAPSPRPSK